MLQIFVVTMELQGSQHKIGDTLKIGDTHKIEGAHCAVENTETVTITGMSNNAVG